MIVLRQKSFSDIEEQREFGKVQSAIRHLKRDIQLGEATGKAKAGAHLTTGDVHAISVISRAQSIGASSKNAPKKFKISSKRTKMTPEALKRNSEVWKKMDESGKGANMVGGRYYIPGTDPLSVRENWLKNHRNPGEVVQRHGVTTVVEGKPALTPFWIDDALAIKNLK